MPNSREPEQQILLEIGRWLSVNGEAIYGTRPWAAFGEGPTEVKDGAFTDTARQEFTAADIRFTTKGDTLYAIALALAADGKLLIRSLASGSPHLKGEITSVRLLGSPAPVKWSRDASGLSIALPEARPCGHALALAIAIRKP